jgi:hypothetical protein
MFMAGRAEQREELLLLLEALKDSHLLSDVEAVDAFFGVLHELTAQWAFPPASDADHVVAALDPDTAAWATEGIRPAEIPIWKAFKVVPEMAGRWTAAGLGVADLILWSHAPQFRVLDPELIAGWKQYASEVTHHTMEQMVAAGIPAHNGIVWWRTDWSWHSLYDMKPWYDAFTSTKHPEDLLINFENGRHVADVVAWEAHGLVGAELEYFHRKGYAPEEAAGLLASGISGAEAVTLTTRLDALAATLTGPDWDELWGVAQPQGWLVVNVVADEEGRRVWLANDQAQETELRVVISPKGTFVDGTRVTQFKPGIWTPAESSLTFEQVLHNL